MISALLTLLSNAMSTLATPGQPGPEQQDAPLTESERKLLARLLSDPTYFPIEFRTWIRTYLEGSDIRLPSSAIVGGNAPRVNLPAGIILPSAASAAPSNCLPCNGAEYLRSEYELLFEAISTDWGAPSSGSVFKVPDFRDRALFGEGSVVGFAATDGRAAGSRGGPFHHHAISTQGTSSVGGHSHGGSSISGGGHEHSYDKPQTQSIQTGTAGGFVGVSTNTFNTPGTSGGGGHSHGLSIASDGGHSHTFNGGTTGGYGQDAGGYAGCKYVITTGKNV